MTTLLEGVYNLTKNNEYLMIGGIQRCEPMSKVQSRKQSSICEIWTSSTTGLLETKGDADQLFHCAQRRLICHSCKLCHLMATILAKRWIAWSARSNHGLRQLVTQVANSTQPVPRSPRIAFANAGNIHETNPLRLDSIRDNDGAKKKKVRIGRGRGSGCGKTSGRGQKGTRARNSVRLGFEGGQTPLQKRLPKRNYYDRFERNLQPVPLGRIQHYIDIGRIDNSEGKAITMRELIRSGCVRKPKDGVLLVKGGAFEEKVDIQITECEPEAASQVLAAGGKVTLAWYNKLGLRVLLKPEKWAQKGLPLPRWARPPPKFEHRYPDRRPDGLPVRRLNSQEDVDQLENAWRRVVHIRERQKQL